MVANLRLEKVGKILLVVLNAASSRRELGKRLVGGVTQQLHERRGIHRLAGRVDRLTPDAWTHQHRQQRALEIRVLQQLQDRAGRWGAAPAWGRCIGGAMGSRGGCVGPAGAPRDSAPVIPPPVHRQAHPKGRPRCR